MIPTCRKRCQASASCSSCGASRGLGQKEQLQQRIKQLDEQIAGLTAQQDAKSKEMSLIEQELQGVRDLWAKNLVQINRLTSLEREAARLQGERGQLIAAAAEAKGKIVETELQILQVDQELSSDVAKELRETDSKIGEYVERKVTAEDQLKRTDLRAPQDGVVFQSTVNTVGGVITAGEPIMLIVPAADNLLVEAKVEPKDIDQVQFGQPVVLRFSAFNMRTTPEVNGTVVRIAADTTTDQRTGQSYYLVRISMTADQIERLGDVKLTPGYAGRSLHSDRRPHHDLVPGQAAARPIDALVPREVSSIVPGRSGANLDSPRAPSPCYNIGPCRAGPSNHEANCPLGAPIRYRANRMYCAPAGARAVAHRRSAAAAGSAAADLRSISVFATA